MEMILIITMKILILIDYDVFPGDEIWMYNYVKENGYNLTKEMPTLATKQEETEKSTENVSQKNESSNSARVRNSRKEI